MKKVLSLVLVLALVIGMVPMYANTVSYSADAVNTLVAEGLVKGDGTGNYNLEGAITRAEFAAMVVRMLGLEEAAKVSNGTTAFTDVPATHWASGYINVAVGTGVINGYGNGLFGTNDNVTYAQAVTMIVRAMGEETDGMSFPYGYIAKATELGITAETSVTSVQDAAIRGIAFTLVANGMEANEATEDRALALVIENYRTTNLEKGEVVLKLLTDFAADDIADADADEGDEFRYNVKSTEDVETLLGKVVWVTFTGRNATAVEINDKDFTYLVGEIEYDEDEEELLEIDGDDYDIAKDEEDDETEDRLVQAYFDNEDESRTKLVKAVIDAQDADDVVFGRATINNGKVIFVDAFQVEDIAPVIGTDGDDIEYYDDGSEVNEDDYEADYLIGVEANEFYLIELDDVKEDDVIHIVEDVDTAIIRTDAKMDGEFVEVEVTDKEIQVDFADGTTKDYDMNLGANKFNPVYTNDKEDYEIVESKNNDWDDDLEEAYDLDDEPADIEFLLDLLGDVQLIRSEKIITEDSFYAVIKNIDDDDIKVFVVDTEETVEYEIKFSTEIIYFAEDDDDDLFDDFEDHNDQQEQIDYFGQHDLVRITLSDDDDDLVETLEMISDLDMDNDHEDYDDHFVGEFIYEERLEDEDGKAVDFTEFENYAVIGEITMRDDDDSIEIDDDNDEYTFNSKSIIIDLDDYSVITPKELDDQIDDGDDEDYMEIETLFATVIVEDEDDEDDDRTIRYLAIHGMDKVDDDEREDGIIVGQFSKLIKDGGDYYIEFEDADGEEYRWMESDDLEDEIPGEDVKDFFDTDYADDYGVYVIEYTFVEDDDDKETEIEVEDVTQLFDMQMYYVEDVDDDRDVTLYLYDESGDNEITITAPFNEEKYDIDVEFFGEDNEIDEEDVVFIKNFDDDNKATNFEGTDRDIDFIYVIDEDGDTDDIITVNGGNTIEANDSLTTGEEVGATPETSATVDVAFNPLFSTIKTVTVTATDVEDAVSAKIGDNTKAIGETINVMTADATVTLEILDADGNVLATGTLAVDENATDIEVEVE